MRRKGGKFPHTNPPPPKEKMNVTYPLRWQKVANQTRLRAICYQILQFCSTG